MKQSRDSKISAIVVEGGALRSVFSAGVLDGFLDENFNPFDFYLGVSSGASNLVFFASGQQGRAFEIVMKLIADDHFIQYRRFLKGGHLLDLDWLFSTYMNEDHAGLNDSFDLINPIYVCVTNINTGNAEYIRAVSDNYKQLLKASMALPYVYRDFPQLKHSFYTDGGVADSIPIKQAIESGAKKIIVIRARHYDYLKSDTLFHRFIRWKLRAYPALVQKMQQRIQLHAESIALIRNPPAGVDIIEVCPPDTFDAGRLSRDKKILTGAYHSGFQMAGKTIETWDALS